MISYGHTVRRAGRTIYASSTVTLDSARRKTPVPALVGSYELLMIVIQDSQVPGEGTSESGRGADKSRPPLPWPWAPVVTTAWAPHQLARPGDLISSGTIPAIKEELRGP
jgi:hypothetical protein